MLYRHARTTIGLTCRTDLASRRQRVVAITFKGVCCSAQCEAIACSRAASTRLIIAAASVPPTAARSIHHPCPLPLRPTSTPQSAHPVLPAHNPNKALTSARAGCGGSGRGPDLRRDRRHVRRWQLPEAGGPLPPRPRPQPPAGARARCGQSFGRRSVVRAG